MSVASRSAGGQLRQAPGAEAAVAALCLSYQDPHRFLGSSAAVVPIKYH